MFGWGSNSFGQLGIGTSGNCIRVPIKILSLGWTPIKKLIAGESFSGAISYCGALYMWGANEFGQLGTGDTNKRVLPTLQQSLRNLKVAHLDLGGAHSAIITENGSLFTFGANHFGQLGHGDTGRRSTFEVLPRQVLELSGIQIVGCSLGRCHTLALTWSGRLYSFGAGTRGQLGLGNNQSSLLPQEVRGPWVEINVRDIQLRNNNQSLILHQMTSSNNNNNVLNANVSGSYVETTEAANEKDVSNMEIDEIDEISSSNEPIIDNSNSAMDNFVVEEPDDLCPPSNTINQKDRNSPVRYLPTFLCTKDNTIYTYKNQGLQIEEYESDPDSDVEEGLAQRKPFILSEVIAGGDQSFFLLKAYNETSPIDKRNLDPSNEIANLDNSVFEKFRDIPKTGAVPLDIVEYIEVVFSSVACWNASYLGNELLRTSSLGNASTQAADGTNSEHEMRQLCKYMTALGITTHNSMEKNNCLVDWLQAFHGFNLIEDAQHPRIDELIHQNIVCLMSNMLDVSIANKNNKSSNSSCDLSDYLNEETLRVYLLLPLSHLFRMKSIEDHAAQQLVSLLAQNILALPSKGLDILQMQWCLLEKRYFKSLIDIFKKSVEFNLLEQFNDNLKAAKDNISKEQQFLNLKHNVHLNISRCLQVLKLLFAINKITQRVSYKEFYIQDIADKFDLRQDYVSWKESGPSARSNHNYLCNYPFIFDPPAKNMILDTDSKMQQIKAANSSVYNQLQSQMVSAIQNSQHTTFYVNPYLDLVVHRKTILHETITQLCTINKHSARNFKQPLRVTFEGEEAIDAGQGMKKEFFLLLMKEMLDAKYGMFVHYQDTNTIWFQHSNVDDLVMYELIGILCGLAIYNNVRLTNQ